MHEQGLISASVYEAQQKGLLEGTSSTASAPTNKTGSTSSESEFLDVKKNASVLIKLLAFFGVILFGIWIFFSLSGSDGKKAISQFAAESGVGKQVIPWPDRASAIADTLVSQNQQVFANVIQGITHPTGKEPSLQKYSVSKLPNSILVNFDVAWKGGFLGGHYVTQVTWEIGENNSSQVRISSDNASTNIEQKNKEALNQYFYEKVYPAFVQGMGN